MPENTEFTENFQAIQANTISASTANSAATSGQSSPASSAALAAQASTANSASPADQTFAANSAALAAQASTANSAATSGQSSPANSASLADQTFTANSAAPAAQASTANSAAPARRKRVFSGVQPSGNIHLGNYLGALKQFVDLQNDYDCIYCVVDEHAITVPQDPKELRKHILDVAALYMAVGVDPKKSIIFVQSEVPGHAQLGWVLTCSSYTGELYRMTQFKAKSGGKESVGSGLLVYPVLMAADILLYDTDIVPVGSDQKQHIELCRDIAIRVNNTVKKTFVVPDGRFMKEGARIMSLDDPTQKMSKSNKNIHSSIALLDDPNKIKKSIMKSVTDSEGIVRFDPTEKPGVSNLMNIYSVLSGESLASIEEMYAGKGYGDFKKDLVGVVQEALAPIQERYNEIRYSEELLATLHDGAERANAIAERTMKRVYDTFGLGVPSKIIR